MWSDPSLGVWIEGPSVQMELVAIGGEVEDQSVGHPSHPRVISTLTVVGERTAGTVELDDPIAWRENTGVEVVRGFDRAVGDLQGD